jgi:nitrile hydratase accessory protein
LIPLEAIPAIPRDRNGPVFREPWEARAFGLAVALQERGLFSWSEWAETLGVVIAETPDPDGSRYYQCWLEALERITAGRGVALPRQV